MKFFKKTSVAVVLTLLLVALCCVWGYTRVYVVNQSPETNISSEHRNAGESNLNYYLNWVDDGADLFSLETTDDIARYNLVWDNRYSSLVAIKTVRYLNGMDIKAYAERVSDQIDLGSRDFLLLLDAGSQSWYVVYGGSLRSYVEQDQTLPQLFQRYLGASFFTGESDHNIISLFKGLETWYADHITPNAAPDHSIFPTDGKVQSITLGAIFSGILLTLLANIWWIILLLIALNLADRVRFERYIAKYPPDAIPMVRFHPILFWHQPGSRWYERMVEREFEDPDDFDDPDFDAGPGGFHDGPNGFNSGGPGAGGPSDGPEGFGANPGGFQGAPGGFHGANFTSSQNDLGNNLMGLFWEVCRTVGGTIRRFLRRF